MDASAFERICERVRPSFVTEFSPVTDDLLMDESWQRPFEATVDRGLGLLLSLPQPSPCVAVEALRPIESVH